MKKKLKVFVIAGEESGCNIAYKILEEMKKEYTLELYGIVNKRVAERFNVHTIFDTEEISIIGFSGIFTSLFRIFKRIKQTRNSIMKVNPDLIISIDSYDFCIRVDEFIRKMMPKKKILHIVSPSVWLYRKSRIKKMEKVYNALLCIFPQELRFFEHSKLKTYYIGNLVFDEFKQEFNKNPNLIAITLGSRISEIQKHHKVIKQVIIDLVKMNKNISIKILSTESMANDIGKKIGYIENVEVISDQVRKNDVVQRARFAIAKSGTNTLEFISSNTPLIVYYKTSWLNEMVAKIIGIRYVNIINIFKNKEIIKEFLQRRFSKKYLLSSALEIFSNEISFQEEMNKLAEINKEFRPTENSTMENNAMKIIANYID